MTDTPQPAQPTLFEVYSDQTPSKERLKSIYIIDKFIFFEYSNPNTVLREKLNHFAVQDVRMIEKEYNDAPLKIINHEEEIRALRQQIEELKNNTPATPKPRRRSLIQRIFNSSNDNDIIDIVEPVITTIASLATDSTVQQLVTSIL
jgi:actin-related protein